MRLRLDLTPRLLETPLAVRFRLLPDALALCIGDPARLGQDLLGLPARLADQRAVLFYIFEVVIVVSIQAFIFAALSAIYIGSAIEPEH